jgi:hypothetical protein
MKEGQKMFKSGQVVTWAVKDTWLESDKTYYEGQYGYILHEDSTTEGVWHVMMMRKGSETLHREEIYGDYLKSAENIK